MTVRHKRNVAAKKAGAPRRPDRDIEHFEPSLRAKRLGFGPEGDGDDDSE